MKIKQLKIKGFKSFAEKTVINFEENFIGIVGPNGSGKSNIIDSVRWVFGEQSNKSLRGNNSADVIFGGTEKRAKQNIAEVTIVLDNSDKHLNIEYDEVAITRRLYRSGNSEYFINKTECRLRDIIDLTLDKGIGKSAFSIISQGKIEEIIMVNPEKRRVVIEEVAGILKYKKRKENTLKKLGRTEENLKQVDLILNEMQERMGPLERQAKAARKFQEYKHMIDEHEVDLIANQFNQKKQEYDELVTIIEDSKLKVIELETADANNEIEVQKLISQTQNISIEINSYNSQIIKFNEQLQKYKSDYQILQERMQYETKSSERKIYLENRIFNTQQDIKQIENEIEVLKPKLNRYVEDKEETENKILLIRNLIKESNQKISQLENELSRISEPYATRKVLESNLEGTIGIVAKLFQTDKQNLEAITVALGGRLNDIVMENKRTSQKAIEFLKNNKYGRQTFLPKDMIKPNSIDTNSLQKLRNFNGFVDVAENLVEYNEANSKVFKHLLGNIIIARDMKSALQITKGVTRYRIVTLEGDVISPSGTMSGGRYKTRSKLVVQAELDQEVIKYEKNMSSLLEVENELEEIFSAKREIEADYQMRYSICQKNNDELKLMLGELENITGNDEGNIKNLDDDIKSVYDKLAKVNVEKTQRELDYKKSNEELEDKRHLQRDISEQIKVLTQQMNKHEVRNSRLEVELKNLLTQLSTDYQMSFEEAYAKAKKDIDIERYEEIVLEFKGKIKNLGPVNLLSIEEYEELEKRYNFIDLQKEDLIVAKRKLEEIIIKLDVFFSESFEDTYSKLRVEFQNIFTELFGGGQADLVLTTPDDMLGTGIEIVAQPPGKKLQTISLLSGGEKSLTAISLLFAILRIKKLPFAILDEVEAALDEVNVKRYAKYIKVFSERTQFIVITHRQGTMETVDALYGITMQEKGVSTVVKVKLGEGEQYV